MTTLRYLRMMRGLRQKKLALLLGVHPVLLGRIENGWYARPPRGFEAACQSVFGGDWTWERLMAPPPEPRPNSDAA